MDKNYLKEYSQRINEMLNAIKINKKNYVDYMNKLDRIFESCHKNDYYDYCEISMVDYDRLRTVVPPKNKIVPLLTIYDEVTLNVIAAIYNIGSKFKEDHDQMMLIGKNEEIEFNMPNMKKWKAIEYLLAISNYEFEKGFKLGLVKLDYLEEVEWILVNTNACN